MAVGLSFAAGSVSLPAAADGSSERAETLFQEARQRMGEGDFGHACPMLEEAYSIDHGPGTLLALALCHEGAGKPASALREYRESLSIAVRANRADRVMVAEAHAERLEASVPRVKVRAPSPEPMGLTLTLDGASVDRATMALGVPVDPGPHIVVASARGVVTWRTAIDVQATSSPVVVDVPPLQTATPAQERSPLLRSSPSRVAAWIAGGTAVAAVATGSVFGVLAFETEASSKKACGGSLQCPESGVDLNHEANRYALVSDVSFAVAAVALAAGVYLFLRTSPASRARPAADAVAVGPWPARSVALAASW
jgi:hypothetical protein